MLQRNRDTRPTALQFWCNLWTEKPQNPHEISRGQLMRSAQIWNSMHLFLFLQYAPSFSFPVALERHSSPWDDMVGSTSKSHSHANAILKKLCPHEQQTWTQTPAQILLLHKCISSSNSRMLHLRNRQNPVGALCLPELTYWQYKVLYSGWAAATNGEKHGPRGSGPGRLCSVGK